jgi:hypothetical protein
MERNYQELRAPSKAPQAKMQKGAAVQYRLDQRQLAAEYKTAIESGKSPVSWIKEHDAKNRGVHSGQILQVATVQGPSVLHS